MLTSFYIDGFKGLKNLKLKFKPKLNVLVGPNGSGKSSILGGLELLSHIVQSEVAQITHKIGVKNPNELFHADAINKEIHMIIQGINETDCRNILYNNNQNGTELEKSINQVSTSSTIEQNLVEKRFDEFVTVNTNYQYECKINFDAQTQLPLYFSFQSIRMDLNFKIKDEVFQSHFGFTYDDEFHITELNNMDAIGKYITQNAMLIKDDFSRQPNIFIKESFLMYLRNYLYPVNNIINDLSFGKAYDIYPNSIKNDNIQHTKMNIEYDGRGLSDFLMNLKKANIKKFEEVIFYMKKLSNNIVDFDVKYNEYEQRNEIFMKQLTSDSPKIVTTLPINSISDGALKWLSLATVVLLSDQPIIIDEPENFLHPDMQERLIQLIRDEAEFNEQIGILTTHSESILNILNPSEILLVHLYNQTTRVDRVIQPEKLQEHMDLTGFNLGWIYQTGTLDDYCY